MIGKDFITTQTRYLLNEFIAPITEKTDKPRQRFLRQALGALLLSGSLVVTDFGRWIHDDCSDIFYRVNPPSYSVKELHDIGDSCTTVPNFS